MMAPGMWMVRGCKVPGATSRSTCTMTMPPELCAAMAWPRATNERFFSIELQESPDDIEECTTRLEPKE